MSSVISLEEAARRTGLTRRQIGDKVAKRELSIERDPVTGEKGIYPHTLRGVNGYQPPEPTPPPKPPPPPPPKPEPWIPGPAELAALIKLDGHARAVAMADLVRQYPHLRAWFRDNPIPEPFRKPQPPPPPPPQAKPEPTPPPEPPPAWQTSWQFDWQVPPRPPEPVPPKPAPPKPPAPEPKPPPVPVAPSASSESVGRLLVDVLWLALARLARNLGISLGHGLRTGARPMVVVLATVAFVVGIYVAVALYSRSHPPAPFVYPTSRQIARPVRHHRAPAATPRVKHPAVPLPAPYLPHPLPPLLPPGAGRQDPARAG